MVATTLDQSTTVEVTALYLEDDYEQIVRPNRRFLIPNYFIHYWVRRLGPTLAWLVVALQQACWRADTARCTISQAELGQEIGVTGRAIRKILKSNPWLPWYVPEISYQKGRLDSTRGVYQPAPNKYSVYASTPLAPEHLTGLFHYLRPSGIAPTLTDIETGLDALLALKSKAALAKLEACIQAGGPTFDTIHTVGQVVGLAAGLDEASFAQVVTPGLQSKFADVQRHLTSIGDTICRQYFRRTWVPLLGPALAWLVIGLRSRGYYNPETEELRDTVTWHKQELAGLLGQTTRNLARLLDHDLAGYFIQVLDCQKHQLTIRVVMAKDPVSPDSIHDDPETPFKGLSNRTKVPVTPPRTGQKFRSPPPSNRTKVPVTAFEPDKSSGHPPSNRTKVPPCKYFKESVPIVVVNKDESLQEMLAAAGLSGPGLARLERRDPPLDPGIVRAVILYAHSHSLGPGYIYRHLDSGDPVDPLFMALAALNEPVLTAFQRAAAELASTATLSRETQALLPPDLVELFARFVEVQAGFEAESVLAMFSRGGAAGWGEAPVEPTPEKGELDLLWKRVQARLRLQLTQIAFAMRVQGTQLIGRRDNHLTIAASNELNRDWLANRYAVMIHRTLADELGVAADALELEFVVAKATQETDDQAGLAQAAGQMCHHQ